MFTGIIEEIGTVFETLHIGGGVQLTIEAQKTAAELRVGDSVAINGVCQTVIGKETRRFTVIAVEETLIKTTIGMMKSSSRVNLELPMLLGDRLGGHIVSGHVDCVGEIESVTMRDTSWITRISIPSQFEKYVIPVGSIAIDGVSLTIASIERSCVTVSIIPHTMEQTIFSLYSPKTRVNIEFDLIGKYIERLMSTRVGRLSTDQISIDQLKTWGYKD
jgi:riboflavin synthase